MIRVLVDQSFIGQTIQPCKKCTVGEDLDKTDFNRIYGVGQLFRLVP